MILRARTILPVSRPPIQNGALLISGNRIKSIGHWRDAVAHNPDSVVDLGGVILLPGLVNAHCHLDYTDMAGQIPPQKSFTDWIKLITAAKSEWSYTEFAASWLRGAEMLARTGTTTVADFENVPELLPYVWPATPLRVLSFLEMTGVKSRRQPQTVLHEAVQHIDSLSHKRCRASLAPHAPYSTVPELLRLSAETARQRGWPLSTHVAESAQEFEMFTRASGEMSDWLRRNERDMSDCGLGSPVQHVHRSGLLGENFLAVHVNYLTPGDAALLGKSKSSVAHCPRSHAYFGHCKFPLAELAQEKVNICLGTDSLATVRKTPRQVVKLSMFDEMRAFASANPGVTPKEILRLATVNGARALGMAQQIGELSQDAFADIIAIPFSGKISEAIEAIVNFTGEVHTSMIDGEWAIAPNG